MLYQLGPITIETAGLEVHEVTRDYGADYAAKDLIGAQRSREFTGEADEKITLSGTIFPYRQAGTFQKLADLEALAKSGVPQLLVRGDGRNLGWMLIERVREKASHISAHGVGRVTTYEIEMVKSPVAASTDSIVSLLVQLFD